MGETTTIQITCKLRDELQQISTKGKTYNDIITELLTSPKVEDMIKTHVPGSGRVMISSAKDQDIIYKVIKCI